jgi:hypothetical protein
MSYVSPNLLPFSVDLILGDKKKSGGNKSGEYWGLFNSGIPCLVLQCEVSRCHARGTTFLFPETEVLLE